MESYRIRKALLDDLHQLSSLFDEYRVFYKKDSDIAKAKEFLSERITRQESEIYIAENEDTRLLGFVQLYPIFSSTRMNRLWLLNDLYVNPEFRGRNVSTALINKAKELAARTNSSGLILETAMSNHIANSLYLKTEFKLDADHNYYYWEG